jgi:uncharacterized membrane protein YkvA (DUF1232 family)
MLRPILDQILVTWRLLRDSRVPLWTKAIPFLGIAYVLSPIDIIPDILIGLGQLDDLGIILGAMRLFEAVSPGYVVEEHRKAIARRHRPLEVIEGARYRVSRKSR